LPCEQRADRNASPLVPLSVLLRERIAIDDAGLGNMWPVFYDTELFARVIEEMAAPLAGLVDKIAGIESRGFVLGAAVASHLRVGFVGIRKGDGLYPGETLRRSPPRTTADAGTPSASSAPRSRAGRARRPRRRLVRDRQPGPDRAAAARAGRRELRRLEHHRQPALAGSCARRSRRATRWSRRAS
jgi:hypothetical protein